MKAFIVLTGSCPDIDATSHCHEHRVGTQAFSVGLSFSCSHTYKWNLGRRLLGQINHFLGADLDEIRNRRYQHLKVENELPDIDPLGSVYIYCAPCACQIETALSLCRGKGISEFLDFAVRIDDRIPSSCRRMTTGAVLLSRLRDDIGEQVAYGRGYSGTEHIDWPWLEQRIYKLDQEACEATNACSSDLLERISSEDHTSGRETAAIIIMGEADLCSPMLEKLPPSGKARMPRETDLYELVRYPNFWSPFWKRQHLGQYIMSHSSLQRAKSRMLLVSPPQPGRPVSPPLARASKRLKTKSVTEESEISIAEAAAA